MIISQAFKAQQDDTIQTKHLIFLSDNKKQTALDSLVDKLVTPFMQNPSNCGISVGISRNGTNYFYNYGEYKRDSKKITSSSTVYEIGSITSLFCGLLLAQAVVEHKIKLNDDIRLYLPEKYSNLTFNRKPIQLKHLSTHTSGLPALPEDIKLQSNFDSLNPYKNYTIQQIYNFLKTTHLNSEPGDVFDYSNLGITLLGLILEKVYNQSFEELVKEKICLPNKMTATGIHVPDSEQAQGYNQDGKSTPAWDLGIFASAGGLRSTTLDMLTFLNFNLLEKDEAVKLSHFPLITERQMAGLGWLIKKTNQGNTMFWQSGATYGFAGFCAMLKEKNSSVVIMCNSATSIDYVGIALLNYLQK